MAESCSVLTQVPDLGLDRVMTYQLGEKSLPLDARIMRSADAVEAL